MKLEDRSMKRGKRENSRRVEEHYLLTRLKATVIVSTSLWVLLTQVRKKALAVEKVLTGVCE